MNPFRNLPAAFDAFRRETGEEPSEAVRRFFAAFAQILDRFEAKGRADGTAGKHFPGPAAFAAFGEKIALGDPELDGYLLEFVRDAYRDGYDAAANHKGG